MNYKDDRVTGTNNPRDSGMGNSTQQNSRDNKDKKYTPANTPDQDSSGNRMNDRE
jgi:hypothetical protein